MTKDMALEKLQAMGQEHVLKYFDDLSSAEQGALLEQIETTDFSVLDTLEDYKKAKEANASSAAKRGEFAPLEAMQVDEISQREAELRAKGLDTIKAGKTAALLLAGGAGTRLGSDNPKGMYDIGINRPVYIFQRIIENLLDVVKESGTWIRLFIMTSENNYEATVKFLKEMNYFGYKEDKICFYKQAMAPSCDYDGKLFMESKGKISTSPNGNAGWYSSLVRAGLDKILAEEGVEWIDVFAVDNVLQRICDPCFVGATVDAKVSVGAKVVRKATPDEKVGVICLEDGHPSIVEYYELSQEMMDARDSKGDYAYNYGVILNYLFHVSELAEIAENKMQLHIVEKAISHIDENGEFVKPDAPNGYKFEQLILDMIHELDSCLPYEVVREKEFAPVKNKTGVDSVESARELCLKNGIEL